MFETDRCSLWVWSRGRLILGEILHPGDDWDVAEGAENQQFVVTGEDQVGMAVNGEFREFVVFG